MESSDNEQTYSKGKLRLYLFCADDLLLPRLGCFLHLFMCEKLIIIN